MPGHILMIETGGTFGTELNEAGLRALSNCSVFDYPEVAAEIAEYGFDFEVIRPFRLLSENMTFQRWQDLLNLLRGLDLKQYDGVILAHGTDTLAYSVNLAALTLGKIDIPFVFVSANRPLSDALSNGIANFCGALDLIHKGEKGVFAVYRNGDGRIYVHRGGRLRQMDSLHPGFYSQHEVYYAEISEREVLVNPDSRNLSEQTDFSGFREETLCGDIMQIYPYPTLNYERLNLAGVKGILHYTYHTGMYCGEGDSENLDTLIRRAEGIPIVMVGGTALEAKYASALQEASQLIFCDDTAAETVYLKMQFLLAMDDRKKALELLTQNLIGEIVGA